MKNKVLLIGLVCTAPLVFGTLAYVYKWDVGSAANYGELIPPRPLSGPPFDRLRGKWLLVSVDSAACDAWCEKKLYYLRQLRRAQGKDMDRVERLWLLDQLEPGASAYNLLHPFKLDGRLDRIALERSLDEIVRRHEILRTTFAAPDGASMQVIHPPRHQPLSLCPPRPAAGR